VGKERPRWCPRYSYAYTPKKTKDFEALIAAHFAVYMRNEGFSLTDGPVAVNVIVFKKIPKSWSKGKKAAALSHEFIPIDKPDNDNMIKSIFDSLNNIVYDDDSRINSQFSQKFYAEENLIHISVNYHPVSKYHECKYPMPETVMCDCGYCKA